MSYATNYCSPVKKNKLVEDSLQLRLNYKHANECLKWGSISIGILTVLLFDISNKCPYAFSRWYYVEYTAAAFLIVTAVLYYLKYIYYIFFSRPVKGTSEQKSLLNFPDTDSFIVEKLAVNQSETSNEELPLNATILSWHSSFNESNRRIGPVNWSFRDSTSLRTTRVGSPENTSRKSSVQSSPLDSSGINRSTSFYQKHAKDETIIDERGLQQYLKEISKEEPVSDFDDTQNAPYSTSKNSFWNYCNTAAKLLKTSLYQLSPSTGPTNKQSNKDETGTRNSNANSEIIKAFSSASLSQYVANLRMWISITILQRLEAEINKIDVAFKSRGFSDIQIGSVGLERLKKTVENQQFVVQHVPSLPLVVPFLEMSTNQEYLVQRIKDLAKGSCIADYRWNSGSSYHGLNWDEHLPTDSAIIFHLFCTYLDSQLMPLPQPGGRPFFNRYVILGDKKSTKETLAEVKNKSRCAILCTNQLKPKFNFISDNKIHNCAYDRNNLFYVIIQFLAYMKCHHEGLLEGVNLGKSGINILCVLESKL